MSDLGNSSEHDAIRALSGSSGSVESYSVRFEMDDKGNPRIYLRVPCSDEWGNTHCEHSIGYHTAGRLSNELREASDFAYHNTETRHKFKQDPEYPWFCQHCGYAEHEELKHLPNKKLSASNKEIE